VYGSLLTGWLKLFPVIKCECGWKIIDWLVKSRSNKKMSERRWQIINFLIEFVTSCKMGECDRQIVDWLVEFIPSCKVSEDGRLPTFTLNDHDVVS
jgi:hypothetical protein